MNRNQPKESTHNTSNHTLIPKNNESIYDGLPEEDKFFSLERIHNNGPSYANNSTNNKWKISLNTKFVELLNIILLVKKCNHMFMKYKLHQKVTVYNRIPIIEVCSLFAEEIYNKYFTVTFKDWRKKKRRTKNFFLFNVSLCFWKMNPL